MLDFRLFLKSVFMTLKRQQVLRSGDRETLSDLERVTLAEMFLVDHFWHAHLETHLGPTQGGVGNFGLAGEDKTSVDSVPIHDLRELMLEFFCSAQNKKVDLLPVSEVESII
jgi:hypothetical protein